MSDLSQILHLVVDGDLSDSEIHEISREITKDIGKDLISLIDFEKVVIFEKKFEKRNVSRYSNKLQNSKNQVFIALTHLKASRITITSSITLIN